MELDTFLASPRWEILQTVVAKPSSPMEIAEKLNITISYVSQQLKLLEAAGLVKKEKTGAFEKGKPRNLFSLSNEALYIIPLTKGLNKKKLFSLTEYHKIILRIWFLENSSLHYSVEKFFWKIEKYLEEIKSIYVDFSKLEPRVIIVLKEKTSKQKIDSRLKTTKMEYKILSIEEFSKLSAENLHMIYTDYSQKEEIEMKGGSEKE